MSTTVHDRIDETREAIQRLRAPQPKGIRRPPGPSGRSAMLQVLTRRLPLYELIAHMTATYQPLGYVHMAREHMYVLSDPDVIWQAFVTDAKSTVKGRGLQLTRPLLGNGLLNSEGADHMRNRRLVQPVFHRQRIAGYCDDIVSATLDTEQRWRTLTGSASVQIDVVEQMSNLTLDVVGRTLFGADLTGNASAVGQALTSVLEGFSLAVRPTSAFFLRLPLPARQRMIAAIQDLDGIIATLIEEKREEVAAGRPGADVLSLLLQTVDVETGRPMTDEEIRDETMTMVLAGHETTAMALSWALRDLSMNPDLRAWLRVEVDAVAADGMADLSSLPRTFAVIAESMRLHPPAWVLGRSVTSSIDLAGFELPAGSTFLASQYAMHRDPRFWPHATRYDPTRWLDAEGAFDERNPDVPRGAWFPFGFGARRCIGEQFAWVEAVLALARFVRDWDIDVIDAEAVQPLAAVTMRPRDAMMARLTQRQSA